MYLDLAPFGGRVPIDQELLVRGLVRVGDHIQEFWLSDGRWVHMIEVRLAD